MTVTQPRTPATRQPVQPVQPLLPEDPPRIGEFWLQGRLAANAAGLVYAGRDENGRVAAVAMMAEGAADDAAARDRFGWSVDRLPPEVVLARNSIDDDDLALWVAVTSESPSADGRSELETEAGLGTSPNGQPQSQHDGPVPQLSQGDGQPLSQGDGQPPGLDGQPSALLQQQNGKPLHLQQPQPVQQPQLLQPEKQEQDGQPPRVSQEAYEHAATVLSGVLMDRIPHLGRFRGPDFLHHWDGRRRPGLFRLWPLPWPAALKTASRLALILSLLTMLVLMALALLIAWLLFRNQPEVDPGPVIPDPNGTRTVTVTPTQPQSSGTQPTPDPTGTTSAPRPTTGPPTTGPIPTRLPSSASTPGDPGDKF